MAQVASPSASPSVSIVASPSKVELNKEQAYTILDNLSLLAFEPHKRHRLTYSPTSISLGTDYGWARRVGGAWNYYTGSEVTPDLESLLPLINKVHNCITKNQTILNDYHERNGCMSKVETAVKGLEALKINQYQGLDTKQKLIEKSIEILKTIKTILEKKQAETTEGYIKGFSKKREEEEFLQKQKDELITRLKEENRILRVQAGAAGNYKNLSPEQLIELAQDCLKLASLKMKEAKARGIESLRATTT